MGYSDKQKSVIVEKLAEVDKCLADCAEKFLQLMSLCPCDAAAHTEHLTPPEILVPWVAGTLRAGTHVLLYPFFAIK